MEASYFTNKTSQKSHKTYQSAGATDIKNPTRSEGFQVNDYGTATGINFEYEDRTQQALKMANTKDT